MQSLT